MKRIFTLASLALLIAGTVNAQGYRHWDFTNWSQHTINNLMVEAAQTRPAKGWSDIEKRADDKEGATAPEATKDNCFWLDDEGGAWLTSPDGGSLKANGEVIAETEGLIFNPAYAQNRSLAIAVNYPSTSLGTYSGPQYLWLGGGSKNLACFTIPNVTVGQKITMTVESHKPSDARGVELYVGSVSAENKIGESFKPKTQETYTWENWTLPEGVELTGTVDIIVYNTSGCHLYNIEVGENTGEVKRPVALLYNGSLDADLAYKLLATDRTLAVTPIEASAALTLEGLDSYQVVIVSSTVGDEGLAALKDIRPFVPMLNLNPRAYALWGYGQAVEGSSPFASVSNTSHALFNGVTLIEDEDPEATNALVMPFSDGFVSLTGVTLGGPFASDLVLATLYQQPEAVAIHSHNQGHNSYLYIPYTQEVLVQPSAAVIISNAVNLLAGSKSQVTPAPKPTVTLSYKRMNTDVTLKSGLTGAVIYYTLDGSTPTTGSTVYTEPFNVTAETTVKAVVIADGYLLSDVAEQVVDLKDQALEPTIDVAYEPGRATVTISGADEEAEIWFNLTGSNDPARSQRYTEPVVLTSSATIAAFTGGSDNILRSEVVTKPVSISGVTTYTELLSKFEGASFNSVGNVLNGGFNYYTDTVIDSQVLKDVNGADSIVNTYQKRDSLVVYTLSDDWNVETYGQGLYYTKATAEHKVANASGYNPETVFDDQFADGEMTNNAMQFQIVSKKDGDGRLDPPTAMLQTRRAFTGPFEVSIYYSGKDVARDRVLDVLVSTDTLKADGWTKIGEMQSVAQPNLDGTADKSFRIWKRGAAVYTGSDQVFVKVAAVEGAKDVNLFTVLVKAPSIDNAINTVGQDGRPLANGRIYDLQGRRIVGTPAKGIYITNGKKYHVK
jgi:hypothetical protein